MSGFSSNRCASGAFEGIQKALISCNAVPLTVSQCCMDVHDKSCSILLLTEDTLRTVRTLACWLRARNLLQRLLSYNLTKSCSLTHCTLRTCTLPVCMAVSQTMECPERSVS